MLPKLRETVKIKFWSLRNGLGPNMGVVYDIDTEVEREAYRVKTATGWKWQVKGLNTLNKYDFTADQDQEIFDEYGENLEFVLT